MMWARLIHLHIVKNFSGKKLWRLGPQSSFDGESFGGLSINTEGNQGKTEKLVDKTLVS